MIFTSGKLWGTATTSLEPTPVLLAFVAHYLNLGAHQVRIYMEQANPEFEAIVASEERVVLIPTGDDYWRSQHDIARPERIVARLRLNLAHAMRTMNCKWILHVDTDEYLIDHEKVLQKLKDLPRSVSVLSVPNAERVFLSATRGKSVFEGVFRVPFAREGEERDQAAKRAIRDVYGKAGYYLPRGVSGYSGYKSFFRTGAKLRVGVHQPLPRKLWLNHPARRYYPHPVLMHFDSFTQRHWRHKMLRMRKPVEEALASQDGPTGMQISRIRIVKQVMSLSNEDWHSGLTQLYNEILTLTDAQVRRLEHYGKLLTVSFDPAAQVQDRWPGIAADMSPDAIDLALEALRG